MKVLKPPQKNTPLKTPAMAIAPQLKRVVGDQNHFHRRLITTTPFYELRT